MLSLRLKKIAEKIDKEDIVLDVGTDHAYLPIYIKKNNLCKEVYASDISPNAVQSGLANIKKAALDIKIYVSDGINNIPEKFNTLVISGMGTNTICHILENKKLPKKIILSSNNELYKLRKFMNKLNYKIISEDIVYEKGKYYDIITYITGKEKLSFYELNFGKSNDKKYINHLYKKELEIFKKCNFKKKLKILKRLIYLKLKKK